MKKQVDASSYTTPRGTTHIGPYTGLTPRRSQSGERDVSGATIPARPGLPPPLTPSLEKHNTHLFGDVAEWLRSGLQIRLHRFDSGTRLHLKSMG